MQAALIVRPREMPQTATYSHLCMKADSRNRSLILQPDSHENQFLSAMERTMQFFEQRQVGGNKAAN
jgi:hypothetical protein